MIAHIFQGSRETRDRRNIDDKRSGCGDVESKQWGNRHYPTPVTRKSVNGEKKKSKRKRKLDRSHSLIGSTSICGSTGMLREGSVGTISEQITLNHLGDPSKFFYASIMAYSSKLMTHFFGQLVLHIFYIRCPAQEALKAHKKIPLHVCIFWNCSQPQKKNSPKPRPILVFYLQLL